MSGALDWTSPDPSPPLPYGWTDADLATLKHIAAELGISPLEVMALLYSESGLNPKASPEGLAGLTPVIETEMGWPHGTIAQLNAGPITAYLQAVFQLWVHTAEKYVHSTYPARAAKLGVTPGTALYGYHGFVGPMTTAQNAATVLGKKPPVWPVTWTSKGWTYQGAPVREAIGRELTGLEGIYAGNPGLDLGQKGTITLGDMQARVNKKAVELQANPQTRALYTRLRSFDDLPTGEVPPLSSLFNAIRPLWQQLTGTDVHTTAGAAQATNIPDEPHASSPSASSASSGGLGEVVVVGLVIAAAAAAAGVFKSTRRKRR